MILPQIVISLLPLLLPLTTAYSIDQKSCSNIQVNPNLTPDDIDRAVQEALNIAQYAAFRMEASNGVTPGDIVETLLGHGNRQTFVDKMNLLPRIGQRSIIDNGVNIVCGTRYIQLNPDGLSFIDSRFPNMGPILLSHDGQNTEPCSGTEVAFGFPTGSNDAQQPSWVTVLCDGEEKVFFDPPTMNNDVWNAEWEHIADGRDTITGVEASAEFISGHLLHELLHFVDPTLTQTLSNGDGEAYKLPDIVALPDNVKASNTEGYVYLATGLYVIPYQLTNNGEFVRLAPILRPQLGPHSPVEPPH